MIDLHSHILPGVDDGSPDLQTSLAMARMAVDDGIHTMACTPHFMPGLYNNEATDIKLRVAAFSLELTKHNIPLQVVAGGDVHVRHDIVEALRQQKILTLNGTRFVLLEPPQVVLPVKFDELIFKMVAAGFVPIITHPERLSWIEQHAALLPRLVMAGAWMQITAGSLTGRFGKRAQYWASRLLQSGLVHIMASDAHNLGSRPPRLSNAVALARREVGDLEAQNLVLTRPQMILNNFAVQAAPAAATEKRS
jgi:protein-tyrosine phosphatase